MKKKNSGNISIQISITPAAKEVVDGIAADTEIAQKRILSKVYEWFALLPHDAQKAILWPPKLAEEIDATVVALEYLARLRQAGKAGEPTSLLTHWQKLLEEHRPGTPGGKAHSGGAKQPPPRSQAG